MSAFGADFVASWGLDTTKFDRAHARMQRQTEARNRRIEQSFTALGQVIAGRAGLGLAIGAVESFLKSNEHMAAEVERAGRKIGGVYRGVGRDLTFALVEQADAAEGFASGLETVRSAAVDLVGDWQATLLNPEFGLAAIFSGRLPDPVRAFGHSAEIGRLRETRLEQAKVNAGLREARDLRRQIEADLLGLGGNSVGESLLRAAHEFEDAMGRIALKEQAGEFTAALAEGLRHAERERHELRVANIRAEAERERVEAARTLRHETTVRRLADRQTRLGLEDRISGETTRDREIAKARARADQEIARINREAAGGVLQFEGTHPAIEVERRLREEIRAINAEFNRDEAGRRGERARTFRDRQREIRDLSFARRRLAEDGGGFGLRRDELAADFADRIASVRGDDSLTAEQRRDLVRSLRAEQGLTVAAEREAFERRERDRQRFSVLGSGLGGAGAAGARARVLALGPASAGASAARQQQRQTGEIAENTKSAVDELKEIRASLERRTEVGAVLF